MLYTNFNLPLVTIRNILSGLLFTDKDLCE